MSFEEKSLRVRLIILKAIFRSSEVEARSQRVWKEREEAGKGEFSVLHAALAGVSWLIKGKGLTKT